MRVVSGMLKGFVFQPPANLPARPTTDFARTAIFNILSNWIAFDGVRVLDLFAGTGAISLEFLSRGASHVIAVDQDTRCIRFMRSLKQRLHLAQWQIIRMDAFRFLKGWVGNFDVIFAGPPYALQMKIRQIPELVFQYERLAPGGILIVEHHWRTSLEGLPHLFDQRRYGASVFSFFGLREADNA